MADDIAIAVVGAGLIGKRHVSAIAGVEGVRLACIVDPSEPGQEFANQVGADWHPSIDDMFSQAKIDGVILATPSQKHVENALRCVSENCPTLVEKPIGVNAAEAERLVVDAKLAGVPILVGHHRRHTDMIVKAKSIIDDGTLGRVVSFQATCWFHKPTEYFDVAWRSKPGGGPVFINLIHDLNIMIHFFGEVTSVSAMVSNSVRQGEVEDTANILLRFQSGVLGTVSVSDTVAAPWSWELTAGENPAYPKTTESCYLIGGTDASLALPNLSVWRHEGPPSWLNPINETLVPFGNDDPLIAQIRHFVSVIKGEQEPLVSGEDGLNTLRVVEAVKAAAETGETVKLVPFG